MTEEMDTFLATVDEFVDDEERIVTCKWLCLQLAVSLRKSQEILQNYIDSCRKQDKLLEVVHTLTGRFEKGLVISLVKDRELENAKSRLDEVVASSLYSVQKGQLVDMSVLYTAGYEATSNSYEELIKMGSIEYSGAKKLSNDEIRKLRTTAPGATKDVSSDIEKQFAKPQALKKPNINFFGKSSNKQVDQTSNTSSGDNGLSQKKSPLGVTKFLKKEKPDPFSIDRVKTKEVKQEVGETAPNESENSTSNTAPKKSYTKPKSSQIGVTNFLSKEKFDPFAENQPKLKESKLENIQKEETVPKTLSTKTEVTREQPIEIPDELKIDDFSDDDEEEIFKMKVTKPKKKSNSKTTKKRKRIEWLSSSSEEEREEEDIIPPSPPRKRMQDSPVKERNKRMKKALKTKTFVDEEGCMVTEKFYELEECNEAEPVALGNGVQQDKTQTKQSPIKKKTPFSSTAAQPKKQKQASITGFFKKK